MSYTYDVIIAVTGDLNAAVTDARHEGLNAEPEPHVAGNRLRVRTTYKSGVNAEAYVNASRLVQTGRAQIVSVQCYEDPAWVHAELIRKLYD